MMDSISLTVTYFAVLLGLGILVANVLKKRNIPDTFFLLLLGLLFSPTIFSNPLVAKYVTIQLVDVSAMGNIPDFLRTLALILVVFTGTFNLNFKIFKKYSNITFKLAFLGVIFNTVFIGIIAHLIFGLQIVFALLLGAAISGTDSVVFSFERALSKSKSALTILKVESIFNSPISVLIPLIFLDFLGMHSGTLIEPMKYLSQFWLLVTIGVGTGLIVGLSVTKIFKGMLKEYSALLLFAIALITYAMATGVNGSGILAVAVCGLVAGNFTIPAKGGKEGIIRFHDQFSEMLRISVFTLLGAQVTLFMGIEEFILIVVFFIVAFSLRPVFLLPLLGKMRKKFSRKDVTLMSFIAPRGLEAAAMIPILAVALVATGGQAVADKMVNIVFMFILLSVLFSTVIAEIGGMERFQGPKGRKGEKKEWEKKPLEVETVKEKNGYDSFLVVEEGKEDSKG